MEACGKMKSGKVDVSGSFTSEVFLHGPPLLFDHLAALFRSFLVHGDVTEQLLCCAFLPLFKGGLKDETRIDSYRAIAGSSLVLKLFDNVVLLLWGHCPVTASNLGLNVGPPPHSAPGLCRRWWGTS